MNSKESLVLGGFFGCVIGALFLAFGTMSNLLCEMLFWSFVSYVAVIYLEIVPNFAKALMKKYSSVAAYLTYLAWVPIVIGAAMVTFLGSLLFIDYDIVELSCLLKSAKVVLMIMMSGSLLIAHIKQSDKVKLLFGI
jgi:hypothetical protein